MCPACALCCGRINVTPLTWAGLCCATCGGLFLKPAGCWLLPLRNSGQFHLLTKVWLLLSVRKSLQGLLSLLCAEKERKQHVGKLNYEHFLCPRSGFSFCETGIKMNKLEKTRLWEVVWRVMNWVKHLHSDMMTYCKNSVLIVLLWLRQKSKQNDIILFLTSVALVTIT